MTNMREKFIKEAIETIEAHYSHLNEKERRELAIFKSSRQLSPHDYNRLMELKDSVKVKI